MKSKICLRTHTLIFFAITMLATNVHQNNLAPIMPNIDSLAQRPPGWQQVRILTANVGNLSLACSGHYNNKLCKKSVEENVAKNIKALHPDIVFFQELIHPSQCEGWVENNKGRVCFGIGSQSEPNQARRLLGEAYTIVCASRMRVEVGHPVGMECIAVKIQAGAIEGYLAGKTYESLDGLDTLGGECNPEFVIMSAKAKVHNIDLKLINAHPHSRDRNCRDESLRQIFERPKNATLTSSENIIIAGDFNFDPFRSINNPPDIWLQNVGLFGSGKPFYYHSGLAEHDPPYPTANFLLQKKTIDHVVSNFATGICVTLGEAPRTQRIDGGKGMDHKAVLCDMWIPPQ